MVLQAFIDDSGSEPQSPVFLLAGFIADSERWARFSDKWQETLDADPPIGYLRMAEANSLRGEFDKSKGWGADSRVAKVLQLAGVISEFAQFRVYSAIRNDIFKRLITDLPFPKRNLFSDSPYLFMFMQTVLVLAAASPQLGVQEPCDFIFDEQLGQSVEATAMWPGMCDMAKQVTQTDISKFLGSLPIFRKDEQFRPLQAADLYAWHLHRNYMNKRNLHGLIPEPLRALSSIPAIVRDVQGPELKRLAEHLQRIGLAFMEQNPGIKFVPAGKTNRRAARRGPKKPSSASRRRAALANNRR